MPRARKTELPGGDLPQANPFEEARKRFNDTFAEGVGYNPSALRETIDAMVLSVNTGLDTPDAMRRTNRYKILTTILGQASERAAQNGDMSSHATFMSMQGTFRLMSEVLEVKPVTQAPALPAPQQMRKAKS
jgi:hypothetical protein